MTVVQRIERNVKDATIYAFLNSYWMLKVGDGVVNCYSWSFRATALVLLGWLVQNGLSEGGLRLDVSCACLDGRSLANEKHLR